MHNKKCVKVYCLGLLTLLPLTLFAGTEVYVPLGSANAIAVINADTNKVISEIPGINASHGLAVSMDGELLLAGSLLERPKGAAPPKPQEMSEEDHAAHHSNQSKPGPEKSSQAQMVGTAYLIDVKTQQLLRQIDVPGAIHHALITPDGRFAIFTHPGRGSISVVDIPGKQLLKELPTGVTPNYIVSKRDGSRIYVSNAGDGNISEIDTQSWTVLRNLPAGKTPEHLVLSPDERLLYAANPSSGTVSQVDIDSASVKSLFTVGADPHGVDLSDDGRLLYASSKKDDKVVAYNLASGEMKSLTLSPAPYHITTVRGTGKVYVSSRKSPKIWVLDQQTLTVLGEITIRGEGHEMGVVSR
jgi:YVTN family beta-propeller protein